MHLANLQREFEEWLRQNPIPQLGQLLSRGTTLRQGEPFALYHDFYGKGLSRYRNPLAPLPRDANAELTATFMGATTVKVRIVYAPHYLLNSTAWSRLGGHTRLFCICYASEITADTIVAHPYMIGDPLSFLDAKPPNSWDGTKYGAVDLSAIDEFGRIREVLKRDRSTPNIAPLKDVPERAVKEAFAEILGQPFVPKDWGGERSDLQANVSIRGDRVHAAFLLKGPARFSEMTPAHLGKNGDQIERLFSEPAQLLVLQHCHKVASSVRTTMRAFACSIDNPRYFTIIDGADTVRLFKAYSKCGFSPIG